jgi:hypothetical protein
MGAIRLKAVGSLDHNYRVADSIAVRIENRAGKRSNRHARISRTGDQERSGRKHEKQLLHVVLLRVILALGDVPLASEQASVSKEDLFRGTAE